MIQKHKTMVQCPFCDENVSSLFYNAAESGVMKKLKGYGLCKSCLRIYRIKIEEVKTIDGGLK